MTQTRTSSQNTRQSKVRTIGVVAYEGVEILDMIAPLDVFSLTSFGLQQLHSINENVYPLKIIAKKPGPVAAYNGLKVYADCAYSDIQGEIDTLIIPGAPEVSCLLSDPALRDWLRTIAPKVRRLASVCTGAFLLAEAGLLNGRCATTHWAYSDRLISDYPSVKVEADRIFIRDGFIVTSGGVTSGIDLALALVEEDWGRELALATAQMMVVYLKRPGGQTQYSSYLVRERSNHPDLRELLMWIMDHPSEDLRNEVLADRMSMSLRNFARVFQDETGLTPAKFVEKVRIDMARQYLGDANIRIESVADKAGFKDTEQMRKAFIRNLGITPSEYRQRFCPSDQQPVPVVNDHYLTEIRNKFTGF
ncbi:MAG: GlxA family transcriptional regulator [Gammaproteobacteria bacterium]